MHLAILSNHDFEHAGNDLGHEARADVQHVAKALRDALLPQGFRIEMLSVSDSLEPLKLDLSALQPELVINLCESIGADSRGEIRMAACLEELGIPFTGSGSDALELALHKDVAKMRLRASGVLTPDFWRVEAFEELSFLELTYPLIVKPIREDASIGIEFDSVVHDFAALEKVVLRVLKNFQQPVLIEEFIPGREVNVALWGNQPRRAFPLSEIHFGAAFEHVPNIVSYKAKWEPESPECRDSTSGPCVIDPFVEKRLIQSAIAAFDAIGARDYGRVDFRLREDGQPFVIDLNPNCDLHPQAGLAKAAARAGVSYSDLSLSLVHTALERTHAYSSSHSRRPSTLVTTPVTHRNVLS